LAVTFGNRFYFIMAATIYLIPTFLFDNVLETIPTYVIEAIKKCDVFFVENEKTTRRFCKQVWKEMIIDNYQWHTIHKAEEQVLQQFELAIQQEKNIGIVSEAGCPGIADPGQILVAKAQQLQATVKPLVGPSSILLALMASGMNGQCFTFNGYLPIENIARKKAIQQLEAASAKNNSTQIFIDTPYRNNQLIAEILQTCQPQTKLCIAVNITAAQENIVTKNIADWKKNVPDIHKQLAIFLLQA
jgi:16S rRNA (cytidine1402-2'-O)-methyltransferase